MAHGNWDFCVELMPQLILCDADWAGDVVDATEVGSFCSLEIVVKT